MRSGLLFCGVAAMFVLISGTLHAAQPHGAPPPTVAFAPVIRLDQSPEKKYVGSIVSVESVDIMPRVTGTIKKIHFKEGGMVKEGDLLFEIEDTTYQAKVDSAKAQREQIKAELSYAQIHFNRNEKLSSANAVAQSSYDDAVRLRDLVKAKLDDAEAALRDAENNLSYTKIYAPISGRIGKSAMSRGNLVTPASGKLTDIEMVSPIYVKFSLSEAIFRSDFGGLPKIREQASVRLMLADGSIYPETAKVTLVDNKINKKTNTIMIWATLENKDGQLVSGSYVTVLLSSVRSANQLAILPSALLTDQNGNYIYVLDQENKVIRKNVTPGQTSGDYVIILEGLSPDDRVIVDGTHKTSHGATVVPVPYKKGK